MKNLVYGVWNEKPYDFRGGAASAEDFPQDIKGLDELVPDGSVQALIADKGFLVFDPKVDLSSAFQSYVARASEESCGKCSPCRVGTVALSGLLAQASEKVPDRVEQMDKLAAHIAQSSRCGLGKSCARALRGALQWFPDELNRQQQAHPVQYSQIYSTAPCIEACPSKVDIPRYIDYIRDNRPVHAFSVLTEDYPVVASCGRVCVRFCEAACRRGYAEGAVAIKSLKRYAADVSYETCENLFSKDLIKSKDVAGRRVAIVGSGPAGITCAFHLLRNGVEVEIFEQLDRSGGMLLAGIPSYRLPKDIVQHETQEIMEQMGATFHFNQSLGRDFSIQNLFDRGFEAVFLAIGAGLGSQLGKIDEGLAEGYYSGIEYLWYTHNHTEAESRMNLTDDVVVVGGGNVAMDCVRTARRLGDMKVHVVYRRSEKDMPADHEEVEAAHTEGIEFHTMSHPVEILHDNGRVTGVRLTRMRPKEGEPRTLEAVPGSEFEIACGTVIAAIGQKVDQEVLQTENIPTDKWGCIQTTETTLETAIPGVFAGGDCVLGPKTMVEAMAQGERGARSIRSYLRGLKPVKTFDERMQKFLQLNRLTADEKVRRQLLAVERTDVQEIELEDRLNTFAEVEMALGKEEAIKESERCLRCYRLYSVVSETPM